jgi:hypothetical protein
MNGLKRLRKNREALSVITLLFDIPNVNPFELLNTTVPLVAVCVPAAAATAACTAVIVEPLRPNEMLFEFEKVTALKLFEVVPALKFTAVRLVATEAVTVDALRPKLTPFEFENVTAERLLLVVPAETLMFVSTGTATTLVPNPTP